MSPRSLVGRTGGYRIFEAGLVSVILGAAVLGAVGLTAAVFGAARPVTVWPIAGVLWIGSLAVWRPDRISRPDLAGSVPAAALVVGLAVIGVAGIVNIAHNGQYVRADRDNGVYTSAAFWIANNGDVLVDGRQGPYREIDGVSADSIGQALHAGGDERLEIHGTHMFPTLMAQGEWLGGFRGIQMMPALLGVLALAVFFLFSLWWLRPWMAVIAVSSLAVNFVFVYGVRSILTEPTSLAFGFAGIWMLLAASRTERGAIGRFAMAGGVLAVTLAVRVDAGAAFALLIPATALLIVRRRTEPDHSRWHQFAGFAAGAVPITALAAFDLWGRSPGYAGDLGGQITLIQIAFAGGIAAAIVIVAFAGRTDDRRLVVIRRHLDARRSTIGRIGAALAVAVFGALALVRPLLGRVRRTRGRSGTRAMMDIQTREGFEPDGTLSFDELSIERLGWYLGVIVLALAVVGLAILIRRMIIRVDGEAGLLLTAVLPMTLLYLWKPSVFPDQPWMMRRYLPVVIPGILLLAAVAVDTVLVTIRNRVPPETRSALNGGVIVVVGAIFVLAPLRVTGPLVDIRWQAGGYHGIQKICNEIGDDAIVLFSPRQQVGPTFMSPVRSICDVPVLRYQDGGDEAMAILDIARVADADGKDLWALARTEEDLLHLHPTARDIRYVNVYDTTRLLPTLYRPPADRVPHRMDVFFAEVDR